MNRKVVLTTGSLMLGFLFCLVAWLLILSYRPVFGFRSQMILSGSMAPTIQAGSLVIIQQLLPHQYLVGDVVTFRVPGKEKTFVTHRIITMNRNPSGVLLISTRGDANTNGDSWSINAGLVQGKVMVVLPKIGYLLQGIRTYIGFLLFTLLFFLMAVLPEIRWWGTGIQQGWRKLFSKMRQKGVS